MQFFYGNYQHQVNAVFFRNISRQLVLGQNGRAYLLREEWDLTEKLLAINGGGQPELLGYLSAARQAYSRNGQPAGFPGTPWQMNPQTSLGGPVVSTPPCHSGIQGVDG